MQKHQCKLHDDIATTYKFVFAKNKPIEIEGAVNALRGELRNKILNYPKQRNTKKINIAIKECLKKKSAKITHKRYTLLQIMMKKILKNFTDQMSMDFILTLILTNFQMKQQNL